MANNNNDANDVAFYGAHKFERGRTQNVADDHGSANNNDHSSCPHNSNDKNQTCTIDTAPFDTIAFLNYLDSIDEGLRDRPSDNYYGHRTDTDLGGNDYINNEE